jgi:hypothetical protein
MDGRVILHRCANSPAMLLNAQGAGENGLSKRRKLLISQKLNLGLLWFHHCLIIIAQIGNGALFASWALEDTDALPVPQQRLVEIVDCAGIIG